jgi:uncharacterized membrane protein YqjE
MSEHGAGGGKGLLDSLAALAATLLTIVQTRLDLLSSDLEEERAHLFSLLVSALVALFCLALSVVLATFLVVVVFWDSHRLLALGLLSGFFLVAGLATAGYAMHRARTKPRLFAASLSELSKDRQHLVPRP